MNTDTGTTGTPQVTRPKLTADTIRFAAALALFSFLWMGGLMIVSGVLLPQRLTDIGVANKEAVFGALNTITAIVSLLSNLIAGNLSDRTRSVFGKRTPWVFTGGILGGASLFLIQVLPNAFLIGLSYSISMVGLNMMIAPVIATLSDRIPERQRATMSAFIAAGTLVGQSVGQLVGARFLGQTLPGFVTAGILMGLAGILTVMVCPREGSSRHGETQHEKETLLDLLKSFRPPRNAPDFWRAFVGRSLLILSYYMILNYQLYILQDHIGATDAQASATIATMAIVTLIVSAIATVTSGPLSDLIHRRKIPVVVASILLAVGYLIPWVMPTTTGMILFAAFAGFGYGTYSSVDQALNVDVLPSKETAGKDLGILNIATTLGQAVGPIITSVLVTAMSSYSFVFPTAIAFAVIACVFIMRIKSVR